MERDDKTLAMGLKVKVEPDCKAGVLGWNPVTGRVGRPPKRRRNFPWRWPRYRWRWLFYDCLEWPLWIYRRLTRTHLCRHCAQPLEGYDELEAGHCYGWGGTCADIEAGIIKLVKEAD